MCLYTKQRQQKTAKTDKTVFKVIVLRNSQAFTPYLDEPIPYETLNGQKAFKAKGKTKKLIDFFGFSIDGGNIHTYATAADAWNNVNHASEWGQPAVYECIIPKGTKYYYGYTYGNTPSYASKQIRFVKRLQNPYAPKPTQTELELR